MIKSILGGKSKNLFDISKADVVIHSDMSFSSNVSYNSHFYSIPVEAGQTYTVSYDTYAIEGGGTQITLNCQTGDFYQDGVSLFIQLTPENSINNWKHITHTFTIPSGATKITFSSLKYPNYPKYFRNFQIELGSTATEYVPHELTSYKSIMKVSDGHFVTSFDERMPCKTKNLINSQQIYQISQHMDVTIWQGEVNYVCTFSYELAMFEPNNGSAALFEFVYSDGTYSYIIHRDKYRVLSQITDSKKLTKIRLINWSDVKGILSNIQLEKGTTATDYVPYGYV